MIIACLIARVTHQAEKGEGGTVYSLIVALLTYRPQDDFTVQRLHNTVTQDITGPDKETTALFT